MIALRRVVRRLCRSPAFLITTVASLAVCFSVNGALLGILDVLALRPQPGIADPGSVIRVFQYRADGELRYPIADWFAALQALKPTSARLAYYAPALVDVDGPGPARHVVADMISPSYFRVLGARMAIGRAIAPADSAFAAGAAPAVMSWRYWQREAGGDSAVLGQALRVNGHAAFRIVGVAAPGFHGTEGLMQADFWLPDAAMPGLSPFGRIVGRAANADPARVAAELTVLSKRIEERATESADLYARRVGSRFEVEPLRGGLHPEFDAVFARTVGAAFAVCLAVLLLACTNVGGLLLIRTVNRRRDIALGRALGATRRRLIQDVFTEAVLVCVVGGAVGMALVPAAAGLLLHAVDLGVPFDVRVPLDPLWSFAMMGAALATAVLCGMVPALRAARVDPESELRADAVASAGTPALRRLQGVFVVAQVALALLITGGAMLATLESWHDLQTRLGVMHEERALVTSVPGSGSSNSTSGVPAVAIERRLAADSRVAAVGWAATAPGEPSLMRIALRASGTTGVGKGPLTAVNPVGGRFFAAAGIPVVSGRALEASDDSLAQRVVVLSRALAAHLYPGRAAIGQTVILGGAADRPYQVVGVAGDVTYELGDHPARDVAYVPSVQLGAPIQSAALIIRTAVPVSDAMRSSVDKAIRAAGIIAAPAVTLRQMVEQETYQKRSLGLLLLIAAGLCILLAVIGTYGLTAHEVASRRREIAVRIALGATPGAVVRAFVGRAAVLAVLGLAAGLGISYAAQQLSQVLPFGQPSVNLMASLIGAAVIFATTAGGAALAAFRRARVDPSAVLRSD
jgi:putative ABC transport system permease protein